MNEDQDTTKLLEEFCNEMMRQEAAEAKRRGLLFRLLSWLGVIG